MTPAHLLPIIEVYGGKQYLADKLGVTVRCVDYLLSGQRPITRRMELQIKGLEAQRNQENEQRKDIA